MGEGWFLNALFQSRVPWQLESVVGGKQDVNL